LDKTPAMDRITLAFWSLVLGLCGAIGLLVTVGVYAQLTTQPAARSQARKRRPGPTGARSLMATPWLSAKEGQGTATVRMLGIKTLESKHGQG
jgi:hypothetical protein